MIISALILSLVGLCITVYTYLVEQKVKKNPDYKAVCDISDKISCSKVMISIYSNILPVSNSLVGMIFYSLMAVLSIFHLRYLLITFTFLACVVSGFLAYILFFKIKTICPLCVSLYLINLLLFFASIAAW